MPPRSKTQVITAYRHLFKTALRAVQYSQPARFVVRDRLRDAFRNPSSPFSSSKAQSAAEEGFDAVKIARTLEFLDGAARVKGLEHRILKNLMHVWWEQGKLGRASV